MKPGIHPPYGPVVFRDKAAGSAFLTRSTATSDKTIEWEDANTYPVVDVEISNPADRRNLALAPRAHGRIRPPRSSSPTGSLTGEPTAARPQPKEPWSTRPVRRALAMPTPRSTAHNHREHDQSSSTGIKRNAEVSAPKGCQQRCAVQRRPMEAVTLRWAVRRAACSRCSRTQRPGRQAIRGIQCH
jgi:ribosomal protein L31